MHVTLTGYLCTDVIHGSDCSRVSSSRPEEELHLLLIRFLISEERHGFTAETLRLQEGQQAEAKRKKQTCRQTHRYTDSGESRGRG